jgi:tRNA pseudouridine55 synthase
LQITPQDTSSEKYSNKIFLIDKPLDFTSADIVRIFKKNFKLKKAGHSGTLDPKATGLLIICSDKMTKRINEFIEYDKEYEGVIRIGAKTKSFDTESKEENVIEKFSVSDEDIDRVRRSFMGEVEQLPPMYSAIKHKGKPLYKMARKGKEIERQPRKIFISEFEIKRISETELHFIISSSKGTYIRSIANDFGEKLGVGGYLKELRRTRIGSFVLKDPDEEIGGIRFKILDF